MVPFVRTMVAGASGIGLARQTEEPDSLRRRSYLLYRRAHELVPDSLKEDVERIHRGARAAYDLVSPSREEAKRVEQAVEPVLRTAEIMLGKPTVAKPHLGKPIPRTG